MPWRAKGQEASTSPSLHGEACLHPTCLKGHTQKCLFSFEDKHMLGQHQDLHAVSRPKNIVFMMEMDIITKNHCFYMQTGNPDEIFGRLNASLRAEPTARL